MRIGYVLALKDSLKIEELWICSMIVLHPSVVWKWSLVDILDCYNPKTSLHYNLL